VEELEALEFLVLLSEVEMQLGLVVMVVRMAVEEVVLAISEDQEDITTPLMEWVAAVDRRILED
jgi:hypothetical protein